MAIGFSNPRKLATLNALLGGVTPVIPPMIYVALLTDLNTDAQRANGIFTEVTGVHWTDYARQAVPNDTVNWPVPTTDTSLSQVTKQNGLKITFTLSAVVSGIGPTITGFILLDSPTLSGAANVIASGPLSSGGGVVVAGSEVSFEVGTLVASIQ